MICLNGITLIKLRFLITMFNKPICEKCKGVGFINHKQKNIIIKCTKCLGDGYLDWIENITGKKITPTPIHYNKPFIYTP